ncbi:MAG: UDP-N-acetylmuramoyl-L-alanyl-D-glutamate--2,6-diaminopimelate ligase [Proteobacteria bacterium]|nr:UDP-N-acetylmuramoyl-L-alanyl-D-glutamate--2,6-diaminopimelate ligase [Pseudomonadota bacterium]
MNLGQLLAKVSTVGVFGGVEMDVSGLCVDSRKAKPGCVFVAVTGTRAKGTDFVRDAVMRGAVAVVAEEEVEGGPCTSIVVKDARRALAELACAFFDRPSAGMKVAGVTGTNGKTTTSFLLQHICDVAQLRCGLVGTVRYQIGERTLPASRTTPDALEMQELLAQMRDAGCKSVALEVSSHAVSQRRVEGVDFDAVVFTNLTQDHLDYHGSMEAYFEAKAGLITGLGSQRFKQGVAVLNVDDRHGALLQGRAQKLDIPTIGFGLGSRADFRASNCRSDLNGSNFQLDAVGRSWLAVQALSTAPPVPGRLQPVPGKRSFRVYVDYAHTDDALRNVLRTLRDLDPSHIVTVFGCGGDRDTGKRPLMGQAAEEMSDWVIVTSDNPRSESPEAIAADITRGMRLVNHEVILDRKTAIARAIASAGPRDIVLIAGKGHETTQECAGKIEPFDDIAVAASAVEDRPSDFGR